MKRNATASDDIGLRSLRSSACISPSHCQNHSSANRFKCFVPLTTGTPGLVFNPDKRLIMKGLRDSFLPQPPSFSKKKYYEIHKQLGQGSFGKVMVCILFDIRVIERETEWAIESDMACSPWSTHCCEARCCCELGTGFVQDGLIFKLFTVSSREHWVNSLVE